MKSMNHSGILLCATAKQVPVVDYEKEKNNLDPNFVEAVELLRRCGFINVEFTSKRR